MGITKKEKNLSNLLTIGVAMVQHCHYDDLGSSHTRIILMDGRTVFVEEDNSFSIEKATDATLKLVEKVKKNIITQKVFSIIENGGTVLMQSKDSGVVELDNINDLQELLKLGFTLIE